MSIDYFDIGTVVNVHGIKGEIRVMPTTDDPSRFQLLDTIEIYQGSGKKEYPLESARPHKTLIVLKLQGIEDRDSAEKLKGGVIKVPRSQALPLEEDEYYQKDLLDMDVKTHAGEELGQLVQILETGANDVYIVRSKYADEKDILIPAIKECILDVDLQNKIMTVHLMEGLREL